jgi:uncharacterized protein YjbJ (UPF0337 family)
VALACWIIAVYHADRHPRRGGHPGWPGLETGCGAGVWLAGSGAVDQRLCFLLRRLADMGLLDKLRNKFRMGSGRAKQNAGRAAGDPYLEAKGAGERIGGAAGQVGEQAKDAAKDVRRATGR